MPTVTQKRDLKCAFPGYIADYVRNNHRDASLQKLGSQVTTSFRTSIPVTAHFPLAIDASDILEYNKRGLQPSDNGHPFSTTKVEYSSSAGSFTQSNYSSSGKVESTYSKRPVTDKFFEDYTLPEVLTSWNDAAKLGNRAVRTTLPTKPNAGIAQFLGELKDMPTTMGASIVSSIGKMDRKAATKALGSEYLNAQFGLIPFISDLDKMFKAVVSAPDIIKQYIKDSGKLVRRRMSYPVVTEVLNTQQGSTPLRVLTNEDPMGAWYYYSQTTTRQTNVWFSGAFRYHLPKGDDLLSKAEYYAALAQKVLGVRMSPDVLWELSPWSWLVDWFEDVGSNLSVGTSFAFDNVVMEYGYLMREQIARRVTVSTRREPYGSGNVPPVLHEVVSVTRKERVKASPFGFGVPSTGFSTEQWAILAALGSTKTGGK